MKFIHLTGRLVLAITALIMINTVNAQSTEPVQVVQAQLDAYNRQDVKAFAAVFAEDCQLFNKLGDTLPAVTGRLAIEERYAALFKQYPNNRCTLLGRMVEGNSVIDHELITGREKELRIIAIYEVKQGLITRCWFIR